MLMFHSLIQFRSEAVGLREVTAASVSRSAPVTGGQGTELLVSTAAPAARPQACARCSVHTDRGRRGTAAHWGSPVPQEPPDSSRQVSARAAKRCCCPGRRIPCQFPTGVISQFKARSARARRQQTRQKTPHARSEAAL